MAGTPSPSELPGQPLAAAAAAEDDRLFADAVRTAWSYVEREYQPATGLINSVVSYPYATMWDLASGLAALYSGHRLGLLDDAEYARRMGRALQTVEEMRLFQGVAFNANYSTRTGGIAGRDDRDRRNNPNGYAWSATDLGRFLVWLRIIAQNDPQFTAQAERIAARMDYSRMVEAGYLWGAGLDRRGKLNRYMEGRIPYEQYAAAGYALWGKRADQALRWDANALPIEVFGVPLVADRRGHDHLTSEPLILMGLELGWDSAATELAERVLRVQEERHRRTGQVTIVSEDAIPRAPHFFYYYTINYHGKQFAIATQRAGQVLDSPRWVSAKAAFAWHALRPGEYTRLAVRTVAPAASATLGWSSGVFERTAQPTGSQNINTAAVILESALYRRTGGPLLGAGPSAGGALLAPPAPRSEATPNF